MGDWEHGQSVSIGTYTYNKSSCNQLFTGMENKFKKDNLSFGIFTGVIGTSSDDPALLVDLKECYKYDDKGIFNQNIRIRNCASENTTTTQIRVSPLTVNIPLGKTTSAYVNPHYVGKYNYQTGDWTQGAGVFAGFEQKIGSTTVALEGQRYNLQDFNNHKGNWGVNLIVSKSF